jgi:hypothetical protein
MIVRLCGTDRSVRSVCLLEEIIRESISLECLRIHLTIEDLAQSLREPLETTEVAVLIAGNQEELQAYLALDELLDDVRIVIVLGREADHLLSQAHKLRPRFLCLADSDLTVVGMVLEKMMKGGPFRDIRDKPYAAVM